MSARGTRKLPGFGLTQKPKFQKIDPAEDVWFWNPGRIGVKFAPQDFYDKLKSLREDGDLQVTWSPIRERWLVWVRDAKINRPICQGWRLLFVVEANGQYVPLDERTLAVIYDRSGRKHGNLKEYWMKIEAQMDRDREKAERNRASDVGHSAGDYYDYTQIKNIGKGSKFANYHQGD